MDKSILIRKIAWVSEEIFDALNSFSNGETLVLSAFLLTNFSLEHGPGDFSDLDHKKVIFEIFDDAKCGVDLSAFTADLKANFHFPLNCDLIVRRVKLEQCAMIVGVSTSLLT